MNARALSVWEEVRASYWFVPSVMCAGAALLSVGMVALDGVVGEETLRERTWLNTGTPDGARTLLGTIASSMVGLAGVVFSITIVALTLASGQFGPRLLRNFMRDRGNQVTLGTFLATFVYCLLVLRKVEGGEEDSVFVPQLSVLVGVLLALAGLGVLIYFIHHVAASIQAPHVIAAVAHELEGHIGRLYPERVGDPPEEDGAALAGVDFEADAAPICAGRGGYVQRVEAETLMRTAVKHDLVIRVERRPGSYAQWDDAVLLVWPRGRAPEEAMAELSKAFSVNTERTMTQDVRFGLEQLVEIASRALSPGVNDPFTALQCVDRLGEAMSRLAGRRMPAARRADELQQVRVIAPSAQFSDLLDTAMSQIRRYAAGSLEVLLALLEAQRRIAVRAQREDDRRAIAEHARLTHELAIDSAKADLDRREADRRYARVREALGVPGAGAPAQGASPCADRD